MLDIFQQSNFEFEFTNFILVYFLGYTIIIIIPKLFKNCIFGLIGKFCDKTNRCIHKIFQIFFKINSFRVNIVCTVQQVLHGFEYIRYHYIKPWNAIFPSLA